jgi:integrase/recombinase XerD
VHLCYDDRDRQKGSAMGTIKSVQHTITKQIPSFFETLEQFLASQDVTKGSKVTYRNALKQFFAWFIEAQHTNPTRETILEYKECLDLKGLRPSTRASYLVAVRKFFEWAEGLKIYPNIAKGIKGARRALKHHQKDALTIPQIKKFLSIIDKTSSQGKRDFALINLLLRTGLRLIEVVRADYKDLDLQGDETILWVRGKGRDGKDECVVLAPEALNPLLEYLRSRKANIAAAPLFTSLSDRNYGKRLTTFSLSRIIKRYLRLAGINNRRVTAHSLRHTFGVLSIKAGASLYEVQLAMRHTNPGTTEIYLGDIERQKRLEGAPEKKISALLEAEGIR